MKNAKEIFIALRDYIAKDEPFKADYIEDKIIPLAEGYDLCAPKVPCPPLPCNSPTTPATQEVPNDEFPSNAEEPTQETSGESESPTQEPTKSENDSTKDNDELNFNEAVVRFGNLSKSYMFGKPSWESESRLMAAADRIISYMTTNPDKYMAKGFRAIIDMSPSSKITRKIINGGIIENIMPELISYLNRNGKTLFDLVGKNKYALDSRVRFKKKSVDDVKFMAIHKPFLLKNNKENDGKALIGTNFSNNSACSTTAYILLATNDTSSGRTGDGTYVPLVKGIQKKIDVIYPNWRGVIPDYPDKGSMFKVNTNRLYDFLMNVSEYGITKQNNEGQFIVGIQFGDIREDGIKVIQYFDAEYLATCIKALWQLGEDNLFFFKPIGDAMRLHIIAPDYPYMVNGNPATDFAGIMPIRITEGENVMLYNCENDVAYFEASNTVEDFSE